MDHRTSGDRILKSELARLYQRRLIIDELIRCLEQYAAYGSIDPVDTLNRTTPLNRVQPN